MRLWTAVCAYRDGADEDPAPGEEPLVVEALPDGVPAALAVSVQRFLLLVSDTPPRVK